MDMARWLFPATGLLFVACMAYADDSAADTHKCFGTWKRVAGDNTITFDIKPHTVHINVVAGGNTIDADADYAVTKDGVLFGRIGKVVKKGTEDGPTEGDLFSFKFAVDKDTAALSDLKGTGPHESPEVKQLVEGEYHKEKGSK
jgi:hypothetical protein